MHDIIFIPIHPRTMHINRLRLRITGIDQIGIPKRTQYCNRIMVLPKKRGLI